MKNLFGVFMICLFIASCCADNGDCYQIESPWIQITYDRTSDDKFTYEEINASHILVINDSLMQIVDTLYFNPNVDDNRQVLNLEREFDSNNRIMKEHLYAIQITTISDTIRNIQYDEGTEIRECREPCFPRTRFDIELPMYSNFVYEYKGELLYNNVLNIQK